MKTLFTAICFAAILGSGAASAATLDFSGVQGSNFGDVTVPGATISHEAPGGEILVGSGAASQMDGFCFISTSAFTCEAGGAIDFDNPVTNLTFDIDGAQTGDSVAITAFLDGVSLLTQVFTSNTIADFSSVGPIDSLLFADSSTAAGVGYSTFEFDPTQLVPLPAGMAFMLTALGGLVFLRRRTA